MAGTSIVVKRQWSLFTTTAASAKDAFRTLYEEYNKVITDLEVLRAGMAQLAGSATWDPGSIADGNEEAKEVTVTGAALGDFVIGVSHTIDVADVTLTAAVTAADTVTCVLANNTGGAIDIATGTVAVRVIAASVRATVDAAADLTAASLTTPESGD